MAVHRPFIAPPLKCSLETRTRAAIAMAHALCLADRNAAHLSQAALARAVIFRCHREVMILTFVHCDELDQGKASTIVSIASPASFGR